MQLAVYWGLVQGLLYSRLQSDFRFPPPFPLAHRMELIVRVLENEEDLQLTS
jgi:hypothetical protein